MSTTLASLRLVLCGADGTQGIIQDSSYYTAITTNINLAVKAIAGGIRMPNGVISPPLPELYDMDTVSTSTTAAYKTLPSDYQRHVFMVADENGNQLYPPRGGDYYSFALFLRQISEKDLSQAGSVSNVCVKGTNLYYQGIPTAAYDLTVHFYRVPTDMDLVTNTTVDGIPDAFATNLIKHYVAKEIFGEGLEDSDASKGAAVKYHTLKFFEFMTDFVDFIGIDAEPQYYGDGGYQDLGICD